jgi:hypothetical protein
MNRGFADILSLGRPTVAGMIAVIGIGRTPELKAAQPWAEVCREALHSRAPLAQCGALLALRDRAVGRPDEVVEAYLRSPQGIPTRDDRGRSPGSSRPRSRREGQGDLAFETVRPSEPRAR